MKLSRRDELLISIEHDFDFLIRDVDELVNNTGPLENLLFSYLKDSMERNLRDYKKVVSAIHSTDNQDLTNG